MCLDSVFILIKSAVGRNKEKTMRKEQGVGGVKEINNRQEGMELTGRY